MSVAPVDYAWGRQSVWSQTADRLKDVIGRARRWALVLGVAGAVIATLAVVIGLDDVTGQAASAVAAALVAAAGFFRRRSALEAVEQWTLARSAAEALKAEVHLYLTRSDPYAQADRDERFQSRLDAVEAGVDELLHHARGIDPKDRPLPAVTDVESYVEHRLTPQIDWYAAKADWQAGRLDLLGRLQLGLGIVGAVLGVVAAVSATDTVAVWVPVVTTIAGSVAAYVGVERYEFLLVEYLRTAARLRRLRDRQSRDGAFVKACEDLIGAQNDAWLARMTSEEGEGGR